MRISRRSLIRGSAALALTTLLSDGAWAEEHEDRGVTPDDALAMLKEGNRAFVEDRQPRYPFGPERRHEIAREQHPCATLVCCSDSRVGPEQLFEQGLGELFVVRNAGSTAANYQAMGSIEYGVEHLHAPLLVVLGHSKCGAVSAAVDIVEHNARLPGSIEAMVEPIVPAVLAVRGQPGDLVENAVRENVRRIVGRLRSPEQPLLYPALRAGHLRVVGAVYDLETGVVDFFDEGSRAAVQ